MEWLRKSHDIHEIEYYVDNKIPIYKSRYKKKMAMI